MKPRTFILCTFLTMATVLGSANVILSQKERLSPGDGTVLTEDRITNDTIRTMSPLIDNPEPISKANKDTPKDKLFDINKKIDKDYLSKKKGKLEKVELITWGDYSKRLGKDPKDNAQLSPDRLIWVTQTYFPEGFEHHRVGLIRNARATGLYDAETGLFLGADFKTVE